MNKLAIIILNYNSYNDTIRLVDSFINDGLPSRNIFVVENNSNDKEKISKELPLKNVNLILSPKNLGYAYGNNLGIKKAVEQNFDTFLILNPDIEISVNTINELYRCLKADKDLGVLGPRILDKKNRNTIYSDGGFFKRKNFIGLHKNTTLDKNEAVIDHLNYNIDYVNGSALMFKKEILEKVGYMDETFFMYYEEADWCFKIKKHGYKLAIKTTSEAFHEASNKGTLYHYYIFRNRMLMIKKYNGKRSFLKNFKLEINKILNDNTPFYKNNRLTLFKALISSIFK